jgi:hypothetical protein
MARKGYDEEEEIIWDDPPSVEKGKSSIQEADQDEMVGTADAGDDEVDLAPVQDLPVVEPPVPDLEVPKKASQGVVYRRLPNGALTTD